jgi:arabinofuranosyltransferase
MPDPTPPLNLLRTRLVGSWALPLLATMVGFSALRLAWMSDDALINVRAALNLAHGNGAVFNVGERVQTATSPVWFWIQHLAGRVTGEYIVASMLLGVALTAGAAVALARWARTTAQGLFVAAVFVLSPALVDYATSGLENALGMAALAGWAIAWRRAPVPRTPLDGALVGLASAAVVLTRLDYALLVLPGVLVWAVPPVRARAVRPVAAAVAAGAVPVLVWAAWSAWYYGEVLPNTFHAKTNVDIGRSEMVVSGLRYLAVSTEYDPLLAVVPVVATIAALAVGDRWHQAAAAGMWLYGGYVIWIGGDFMAGRFLTGITVLGLAVLATVPIGRWVSSTTGAWGAAALAAVVVVAVPSLRPLAVAYDTPPRWDYAHRAGVADEASFYRILTGASLYAVLIENGAEVGFTGHDDEERGMRRLWELRRLEKRWYRFQPPPPGEPRPVTEACGGLGNVGLALGPGVHIIDHCALADPFLARLPFRPAEPYLWRIGHFDRVPPTGYIDAVVHAESDRVEDPELRALLEGVWDRVRR